jgi:hypothetical protein
MGPNALQTQLKDGEQPHRTSAQHQGIGVDGLSLRHGGYA